MRAGRPKSSKREAAVTAGPRNQGRDLTRGIKQQQHDRNHKRKSTFLKQLLSDPALSAADKRRIRAAGKCTLTAADLNELIAYQLAFIRRASESGDLSAKDTIVALNKVASQASVAIQLSDESEVGAASIAVSFTLEGLPKSEASQHRPEPGPVGDIIDVEA